VKINRIWRIIRVYVAVLLALIGEFSNSYAYFQFQDLWADYQSAREVAGKYLGSTGYESSQSSIQEIGIFTAYTPSKDETDSSPLIMASNKKVYKGAIACPIKYNFGDKIHIKNIGEFTCEDRMAERYRKGNYFDILMYDYDEALEFGRKELEYTRI